MKIYIEYLAESDRQTPAYKAVESTLRANAAIPCQSSDNLITTLRNINTNDESVLLTILTHGHPDGINFGTRASLLPWRKLCQIVNDCVTNHPLILNLAGVCNSNLIGEFRPLLGQNIQKIWATTDWVNSISKSLLLSNSIDFNDFILNLDEPERIKYQEIV
ncbi:MAG: hypothetical protein OJF59_000601 [Cytophagales bacterium]|jgi:hypothetical protein|nr:MAG: hypothetical protein OJF59_000601 [Cytophagales bacterium]